MCPSVALVYPPFGPSALPSLGLALLSARLRQKGFACRTFYWNLDFIDEIPHADPAERVALYDALTQRGWHPFNEWIFAEALYGGPSPTVHDEELGLLRLGLACPPPADPSLVLTLRERADTIVDRFADRLATYDVIGISSTFYQNIPGLALARRVKERWPNKSIVLGGANTDGPMGPALMRNFRFIDYVFSGETDTAFADLLGVLDQRERHSEIPGLHFRDGDFLGHGPPQPVETRLEQLPTPDFDDYVEAWRRAGLDRWRDLVLNMESSRGCWWGARSHCTFCGLNALGMAYRTKSFAVVREQIETLKARYQPRFIFMTDNIFAQRSLDELLDWLREREIGLDIFYEVKSNLNRDQVRRLSEAGVSSVQPGIESFSTSILKLMRKGVSAAQNIAFLRYAREYGISPSYNIIIGFPGEDASEYDAVLAQFPLLVHLPAPSSIPFVEFHRFSPYHNDASSFGLKLTANPAYRVLFPYVGTDLDEIAYYFVDAGASTNQADLPYFDALTKATLRWGRSHDAYRPQLAWSETRAGISIEDRRFPGEPIKIRLLGASIEVFHLLDKPQSVASLARALRANWGESPEVVPDLSDIMRDYEQGTLPIYFDRQSFLDDPATCLSLLTDARLLFVDSNAGAELLYVALPIRHDSVPSSVEWRRAHV